MKKATQNIKAAVKADVTINTPKEREADQTAQKTPVVAQTEVSTEKPAINETVADNLVMPPALVGETESAASEAEKPEAEKPEAEKPKAEKPEAEKPETKKPETEKPEAENPETMVEQFMRLFAESEFKAKYKQLYPDAKFVLIASDDQIFLDKNEQDAKDHQTTINPLYKVIKVVLD